MAVGVGCTGDHEISHPTRWTDTFKAMPGRQPQEPIFGFGERVYFKITPEKSGRDKLAVDSGIGYFVGMTMRSSE